MAKISDKAVLDKAAALADRTELGSYQGREVLRTSIAIRNAGDGLSQGMAIEPRVLPIGSKAYVLLECEVTGHDYDPIKDTDALELEQVLKAGAATLVDPDLAKGQIDDQNARISEAKDKAAGLLRIEFPAPVAVPDLDEDDEAEVLVRQHQVGAHETLREGCPLCVPTSDPEEIQ